VTRHPSAARPSPHRLAAPRNTLRQRKDWQLIADLIPPRVRVLDIGCGNGELLQVLKEKRAIDARGMELSQAGVNRCVAQGLAVVQGNADKDLAHYPPQGFDYAILSQTLPAMQRPAEALQQLARLARFVVVAIPNFGHWRIRLSLLMRGRMPRSRLLPAQWHETENIHLCTLSDFVALCDSLGLRFDRSVVMSARRVHMRQGRPRAHDNWWAEQGVFLLHKPNGGEA